MARFWSAEKKALKQGLPGIRDWTPEQIEAIVSGKKPKFDGVSLEGHHKYNALDYPQLADDAGNIYPATKAEHLYRWHGGNFQNDTSGMQLNPLFPEEF